MQKHADQDSVATVKFNQNPHSISGWKSSRSCLCPWPSAKTADCVLSPLKLQGCIRICHSPLLVWYLQFSFVAHIKSSCLPHDQNISILHTKSDILNVT